MVTVGLVKELLFLATLSNGFVETKLSVNFSAPILIQVSKNKVNIYYQEEHIWSETIDGPAAFFGIESCDAISRIVACINNKSPWEQYRYIERS
jgi:hypothetical protein